MNFWQELIPEERMIWGVLPFLIIILIFASLGVYFIYTVNWEKNKWKGSFSLATC